MMRDGWVYLGDCYQCRNIARAKSLRRARLDIGVGLEWALADRRQGIRAAE